MKLLVDTSVWPLAMRRDRPPDLPEMTALARALSGGEIVVTTGLILQEILQGFRGPNARDRILARLGALPLLSPDRDDHVEAAELRNLCRRRGVQTGTIDVLIAQLCIRHDLTLLTTGADFPRIAEHSSLKVWQS